MSINAVSMERPQMGSLLLVRKTKDETDDTVSEYVAALIDQNVLPQGSAVAVVPDGFELDVMSLEDLEACIQELVDGRNLLIKCIHEVADHGTSH